MHLREMNGLDHRRAKVSQNVSTLRMQCLSNHLKHDPINMHTKGLNTVIQHTTCWSETNTSCEAVTVGYDKFGNCLRNG